MGVFVALGDGVVLGRAGVAEDDCVGADTTLGLGDETSGAGAVVGSPALQATRTRAAGSTQSRFTQPVFLLANSGPPVVVKPSMMRPEVRSA